MKIGQKYGIQKRIVKFSANVIRNIGGLHKNFASEHLTKVKPQNVK